MNHTLWSLYMEMESMIESFANKNILVTGATGFLGKIFVEKILRVQPNIKKLYLLIRGSDSNSAMHRLHSEVIGKDLFRVIKQKLGTHFHTLISEKVIPVAGDMAMENLGVTNMELLNEMRRQVDIVVNSAANTNFDERYDVAFAINTLGVKHVSSFVNECTNIKLVLHVSTAYVMGEKSGIIMETPFKMSETLNGKNDLNINEEKKMIQERHRQLIIDKANEEAISSYMKDFGIQRAKFHGWPNTYTLTKAMGEMLLLEGRRQDVPFVILRPTIITSIYKEPFPGWIEGIKTIDSFSVPYGRGRTSTFLGDPSKVLDLVVKYANIVLLGAFNAWYFNADREIKVILRLADLYKPYVLINMIFDDTNLNKLLCIYKESFKDGMETFSFDTRSIDWKDYFMNIHFPGLVKHVLSRP
ncbi:putative fatty acyl-CoA reductase 4 isoform X2 [Bidens hawaiensis]|uniref:putative fatty acyl-CoA reductase 4 isoform X2 n=1 Tax=Bidens hawaiensis TaxID=980011 RepID=UPI0040490331